MSLELVAADLEEHLEGVSEELGIDLYRRLWEATPVRTGYARSRWTLEFEDDGRMELTNDTDYLIYLNNGTSEQAPAGFIQDAVATSLALDHEPTGEDHPDFVEGYISDDKGAEPPV